MSRKMKRLKKFENYANAPAKPTTKPTTKPKPGIDPRINPIPGKRPGADPAPKGLQYKDVQELVDKFIGLLKKKSKKEQVEIVKAIKAAGTKTKPTVKPGEKTKPGIDPRINPIPGKSPGVDPRPKGFSESIMNWKTFEASLEDNPGVPSGALRGAEEEAGRELRQRGWNQPQNAHQAGMRLMQLSGQVQQLQQGHEEKLEKLVHDFVIEYYGEFLNDITLNVEIVTPKEAFDKMDDEEGEGEGEMPPPLEEIEDADLKKKIHARKLANVLVQGEAKNVFRIIDLPEFKEKIDEIDPALYDLYVEIARINEWFHWSFPMDANREMWKRGKQQAGTVDVDFKKEDDEENLSSRDAEDIINDLENGESLADIDMPEESSLFATINAYGVDVPVLIHEAVKGILEIIASRTIPDDEETAETVMLNTDNIDNEVEDLRYGPYIAGKLRDAINEMPDHDIDPNLRFYVFGQIFQMEPDDMFDFVYGILTDDTDALQQLRDMVEFIAGVMKEQEFNKALGSDDGDEDFDLSEPDLGQLGLPSTPTPTEAETDDVGYDQMSQREIQALIDQALDDGDIATVRELSKYLK